MTKKQSIIYYFFIALAFIIMLFVTKDLPNKGNIIIYFSIIAIIFIFAVKRSVVNDDKNNKKNVNFENKYKAAETEKKDSEKEEVSVEIKPIKNEESGDVISEAVARNPYTLPSIELLENQDTIEPFIVKMKKSKDLLIPLGTSDNDIVLEKISSMPNLLISGTVMTGKTTFINSIIASILLTKSPDEVKIVIYDSKRVEYNRLNGIPHLLCPVINDSKTASVALQIVIAMMDERYDIFSKKGVSKFEEYNDYVEKEQQNSSNTELHKMFRLVVIIDDLSEMMLVNPKEVEIAIMRITKLGWNVGIHLIVVANHPSSNIINTISKSNFPSRLSFKVTSSRDSIIVIDQPGAEKLAGVGSALYMSRLLEKPIKVSTLLFSDIEISKLIKFVCDQKVTVYDNILIKAIEEKNVPTSGNGSGPGGTDDDPLYNEIVEFAMETGKVSASLLQRRFRLGYNRAIRIVDQLEERGIIGPANGSKPREVLIGKKDK